MKGEGGGRMGIRKPGCVQVTEVRGQSEDFPVVEVYFAIAVDLFC